MLSVYFYFPLPATTLLSGSVAMVQDKIREFEEYCKEKYKHIEELAKTHNVSVIFETI